MPSSVVREPYEVVVPYSTCALVGMEVVHVIKADDAVSADVSTSPIDGSVTEDPADTVVVVNVSSSDSVSLPPPSVVLMR